MGTEIILELQSFYPVDLNVVNTSQTDSEITINMLAHSKSCPCPKCRWKSKHLKIIFKIQGV